jgi:hypothetical protein
LFAYVRASLILFSRSALALATSWKACATALSSVIAMMLADVS